MSRNNVLLKLRKPTIKGFKDQWTDKEYQQAATIAAQQDARDYSEDMELTTAATTHFGSQYSSARLFYDFQKMMGIPIFRYGSVPAEQVAEFMSMMPKGCVNGSNSQSNRKKLLAPQTQAKANTQSFLTLSREQLLVEVPDFRNATKQVRKSLLTCMFDQSKIAISENLFYVRPNPSASRASSDRTTVSTFAGKNSFAPGSSTWRWRPTRSWLSMSIISKVRGKAKNLYRPTPHVSCQH
jgi:hypothetical protein